MPTCNSCETIITKPTRRHQNIVCKRCFQIFCDACSTRLFLKKTSICLCCRMTTNLSAGRFNRKLLDRFNRHDVRWVLAQHAIDYDLQFDKRQLINLLNLYFPNNSSNKAQHDDDAMSEYRQCKICFDGKANCVFLNCGHVMACEMCASKLTNCPICREKIIMPMKIYFSLKASPPPPKLNDSLSVSEIVFNLIIILFVYYYFFY